MCQIIGGDGYSQNACDAGMKIPRDFYAFG